MGFEIVALSARPDLRESFFSAGERLREGAYAFNLSSAGYTRLVCSSVAGDSQESWVALCVDRGEVLGRVSAFHGEVPCIGLFEVSVARSDAQEIALSLIRAGESWLRGRGVAAVYGPMDASTWFQYRLRRYDAPRSSHRNFRWEPTTPPQYLDYFSRAGYVEVERYHTYGFEGNGRYSLRDSARLLAPMTWITRLRGFRYVPLVSPGEDLEAVLSMMYRISIEGFRSNLLYQPISESVFRQLYGAVARSVDLSLSFRVQDRRGQDVGFMFSFEDGDAVVVKSLAILPQARGKHLSTGLLHHTMRAGVLRGRNRCISALVKQGSVSEYLESRHNNGKIEVWRHDYSLLKRSFSSSGEEIGLQSDHLIKNSSSQRSRIASFRDAPGPRGLDFVRKLLERRESPVDFYVNLQKEYGDFIRLPVGLSSFYFVSDPDAIKHILQDHHRDYPKGPAFARFEQVIGKGLITAEGELWKKQRRIINPGMSRERLHGFADQMSRICTRYADRIDRLISDSVDGEIKVDIAAEMMSLSLEIVSETLLGDDMQNEAGRIGEAFTRVLEDWEELQSSPLRLVELLSDGGISRGIRKLVREVPTRSNREVKAAIRELDSVVRSVIERRRSSSDQSASSLVSVLLAARDEQSGDGMSETQLRDEVMTIMLAGHETTANALFWTWVLLSRNSRAMDQIRDEIDTELGGRAPKFDDAIRLKYVSAVFMESMRLYPPVWRLSRQAAKDDVILGYSVPKGAVLVPVAYLVHRDERYWGADVAEFKPERFLSSESSKTRHRFAYIPFGAGPRMCIGNHFAMLEAQIVLAVLCQRFDIRVESADQVPLAPLLTLRPKGKVFARISRRNRA